MITNRALSSSFLLFLLLVIGLDRHPLAAFCTATGEDLATLRSGHAGTESVNLRSAALLWLVCTFGGHGVSLISDAANHSKTSEKNQVSAMIIHILSTSLTAP